MHVFCFCFLLLNFRCILGILIITFFSVVIKSLKKTRNDHLRVQEILTVDKEALGNQR